MLLLIDAGNTRLKWAVAPVAAAAGDDTPDAARWRDGAALAHADIGGTGAAWARHPVSAVLISNVAGAALAARVQTELGWLRRPGGGMPPVRWFAAEPEVAGVRNGYRQPEKLGCDRLAALVGARSLMPGRDLIVATCGTATTVDALTADGRFIGGMILPGLATMARSLAHGTAQLPSLADAPPQADGMAPALFADHTDAAIRNGCLAAQAGAIERAVSAHGNAYCLLSGGAAAWVSATLQAPHAVRDNLVLIGLQVVAAAQPERFAEIPSQPDAAGVSLRRKADRSC